jgi:hypothetical protein
VRAAFVPLLGAAVLAGCGGEGKSDTARQILLVSGRDDHGLLVQKTVGVSRWIGGEPEAHVPDGTLVKVEATHGEWIQVRALERRPARGWVNDYYLRGTAHLTRPVSSFPMNAQVELLDVERERVRVRSLETKQVGWVPRHLVAENPANR